MPSRFGWSRNKEAYKDNVWVQVFSAERKHLDNMKHETWERGRVEGMDKPAHTVIGYQESCNFRYGDEYFKASIEQRLRLVLGVERGGEDERVEGGRVAEAEGRAGVVEDHGRLDVGEVGGAGAVPQDEEDGRLVQPAQPREIDATRARRAAPRQLEGAQGRRADARRRQRQRQGNRSEALGA